MIMYISAVNVELICVVTNIEELFIFASVSVSI